MQEFAIAPLTGRYLWLIPLVAGLVIAAVIIAFGAALVGARSARFEV
jgi:hypothetical protein